VGERADEGILGVKDQRAAAPAGLPCSHVTEATAATDPIFSLTIISAAEMKTTGNDVADDGGCVESFLYTSKLLRCYIGVCGRWV